MDNYQISEKKTGIGKRIGYFFLSFVPFVVCIALQFACVLAVQIIALAIELSYRSIDPSDLDAMMELYMDVATVTGPAGVVTYHIVGTLVFGLWYFLCLKRPRAKLSSSFKKITPACLIVTVVCGVALCLFANGTVAIESVLVPSIVESYMEMAEAAGLGVNAFVIFASIILAPIGEEFVCRGLTLKFGKKCFGKFWIANILQALIFGVMHLNWVQGIYAFVIGLVLGWLVEEYDTILPAMILHCVVNFSSSTYIPYLLTPIPYNLLSGILLTVIPGALVVLMIIWAKSRKKAKTVQAESI